MLPTYDQQGKVLWVALLDQDDADLHIWDELRKLTPDERHLLLLAAHRIAYRIEQMNA